jgi:hypothetical protein
MSAAAETDLNQQRYDPERALRTQGHFVAIKPLKPGPGDLNKQRRIMVNGGVISPVIVPRKPTTNSAPVPPSPPAPARKK